MKTAWQAEGGLAEGKEEATDRHRGYIRSYSLEHDRMSRLYD